MIAMWGQPHNTSLFWEGQVRVGGSCRWVGRVSHSEMYLFGSGEWKHYWLFSIAGTSSTRLDSLLPHRSLLPLQIVPPQSSWLSRRTKLSLASFPTWHLRSSSTLKAFEHVLNPPSFFVKLTIFKIYTVDLSS